MTRPLARIAALFALVAAPVLASAQGYPTNRETRAILESPETRKFFSEQGAEAGGGTPEQLAAFVRAETAKWSKVVKDSGAKVD